MDLLRSCYEIPMRFKDGEPTKVVRWFFCGPDAEIFTKPTIFRSANWESTPYQNNGLGEQRPSNRPWRNGSRAVGFTGRGSGCNFSDDWWAEGIPTSATFVLAKDGNGVPLCCGVDGGDLLLGGDVAVTRRGPGSPAGYLLFGGDASADFHVLNGDLQLDGDAEVHFHPAPPIVTTCCAAVAQELIASFPVFGACPCLAGVICPIVWDGAKWEGTTLPFCSGHTMTVRLYCTGVGPLAWNFDLDIDGVNFITGGITFVGSCAPLHFEGSPLFTLAPFPGCSGFGQVVVDEP